ncbi:MAG: hypothetical protein AB8H79_03850 [Myxococcota bacterium]
MEIVPDPLLVALFLPPFLVAVIGSWLLLWKPLLAWMDERDSASADARAEAARLETQVEDRLQTVRSRLGSVRSEITEMRNQARVDANAEERELLAAARTKADAQVSEATSKITEQSGVARRGLSDAARALADDMATQVLGRAVNGGGADSGSTQPGQA